MNQSFKDSSSHTTISAAGGLVSIPSSKRRGRGSRKSKAGKPLTVQQVRAMIRGNLELKHYLSNFLSSPDTTGVTVHLSSVAQGDLDTNRNGDRITPRSLEVRFGITYGDTYNTVRIIFFQWFQDVGLYPPAVNDVLNPLATTSYLYNTYNMDKRSSYKVLYDGTFVVDSTNTPTIVVDQVLRLSQTPICYLGGSTTDAMTGSIWGLLVSDSGGVPNPSVAISTNLIFTDD